jgi:O-antigen/teichoic acid export membrane protein
MPVSLTNQSNPARLRRWAGYLSWSIADQVILLGIPKLVLFPILAMTLGEGSFGSLVVALGLIQLVGLAPSNGLVGYIIRDFVHEDPHDQETLLRTTLVMTVTVVLPFALVFALGANWIAGLYDGDTNLQSLLPYLAGHLLFSNLVETALSVYRVRRRFDLISIMHGVQSAVLFLAIPLYSYSGMRGVGLAHLLSPAAALLVLAFVERKLLFGAPLYSSRFVRAAMKVWPAFSLSALIALSAGYLDRVLLGYWWSPASVAPFFAAVTTASIITIPGTIVANLIFSILGKVRKAAGFDRQFYAYYAAGVILSSIAAYFVGALFGGMLLRFFYPSLAVAAMELWIPILAGFSLLNVSILLRPFISKFLSPAAMPLLSFASLVARALPLLLLVPKGGPRGAALALLSGGIITAVLWMGLYGRRFLVASSASGTVAGDGVDESVIGE